MFYVEIHLQCLPIEYSIPPYAWITIIGYTCHSFLELQLLLFLFLLFLII